VTEPTTGHWFEPVADHLGKAYLRYSFTKGTAQEVAFLVDELGLKPGQRVLDVGCGPGRHSYGYAEAGLEVVGVDISQRFVDIASSDAPPGATFRRLDARDLPFDAEFDVVVSLCQGGFGLVGGGPGTAVDGDGVVLDQMRRAAKPGGIVAVSAFSAYFQLRWLEETDTFDADRGVNHELGSIRDEDGAETQMDFWTTCFTPRELRLLARQAGLTVRSIWSVTPGAYARDEPTIDTPEFLLVAEKPA